MSPDEEEAEAQDEAPAAPAVDVYSVFRAERLVAYVRRGAGTLRRAGRSDGEPCAFAAIEIFDGGAMAQLAQLAAERVDLEAYLFELGVEGFTVRPGEVHPHAQLRRF